MPAVIESTLYASPGGAVIPGSTQQNSRDDLRLGYQVVLHSVNVATTYSWSLSFASDSPGSVAPGFDGTQSISALLAPEGSTSQDAKFNVDYEGTYLVRLTVDAGLVTEDTQFIRLRVLTLFGALRLLAAGERRDSLGVIPVDASPEGWANDQNANMQRVAILLRRLSTSGRVLYVDANRGRDNTATQNDYDNIIDIPGPESARVEETGIRIRAMAHGDFASINEAITYANDAAARGEPAPSATQPYFLVIRPGVYNEDLNLTAFVHLIGDTSPADSQQFGEGTAGIVLDPVVVRPVHAGGTGTHRFNPSATWQTAQVALYNLHLENTVDTTQPVLDVQGGLLKLVRCVVANTGDDANQGECIRCVVANAAHEPQLWVLDTSIRQEATTANRAALRFDAINGSCYLRASTVAALSCQGVVLNESLYTTCSFYSQHGSQIVGNAPFVGYGDEMKFTRSHVVKPGGGTAIDVSPFGGGAGAKAGDVKLSLFHCEVGTVSFATVGAVGDTEYNASHVTFVGNSSGPMIEYPDAPGDVPNVHTTWAGADAVRYTTDYHDPLAGPAAPATVPVANQLPRANVQEALDLLVLATFPVTGSPFYSLTSAYNGVASLSPFVLGAGLGRNINAVSGAVQIQGGTYPTGPESHLKHGGLQIDGVVDIGGFINGAGSDTVAEVGHSEIGLNPDLLGSGPFIGLGRARWPNGVTTGDRGFAGALIVAGISDVPAAPTSNAPYHLHVRTSPLRSSGTGKAGTLYVVAGGVNDAASADDGGDVHLVGGFHANAGGTVGNVFLVPGIDGGGTGGVVRVVGPANGTQTTLQGANPYVGGQAGTLYIGTPAGIEAFTFTGAESLAQAITLINTTARNVTASENPPTQLQLASEVGPAGDIRVVGDSVGGALNTALGDLTTFAAGTYGDTVALDVPVNNRLRIQGDLEVTGSIISSVFTTVTATGETTDATTLTLWSLTLDDDTAYVIKALVMGRSVVGSTNENTYELRAKVQRRGGGAATLGGAGSVSIFTDEEELNWNAVLDVNANDVRLRVTGDVATTSLAWVARIEYLRVSGVV